MKCCDLVPRRKGVKVPKATSPMFTAWEWSILTYLRTSWILRLILSDMTISCLFILKNMGMVLQKSCHVLEDFSSFELPTNFGASLGSVLTHQMWKFNLCSYLDGNSAKSFSLNLEFHLGPGDLGRRWILQYLNDTVDKKS